MINHCRRNRASWFRAVFEPRINREKTARLFRRLQLKIIVPHRPRLAVENLLRRVIQDRAQRRPAEMLYHRLEFLVVACAHHARQKQIRLPQRRRRLDIRQESRCNCFDLFGGGHLSNSRRFFVPQERPTIARRFNAGLRCKMNRVPEGRQELTRIFCRPCGTRGAIQSVPGVETPGYFLAVPAGQIYLRRFHLVLSELTPIRTRGGKNFNGSCDN